MKTLILAIIALMILSYNSWAQDSLSYQGKTVVRESLSVKNTLFMPLFIIKVEGKVCNGSATGELPESDKLQKALNQLDTDRIDSIRVLKGKDATDSYGMLGEYGVVVVSMKDGSYKDLPQSLKKSCK